MVLAKVEEAPFTVVELVETPAGVYSVRGNLMRRVPSEAERIARINARATARKAKHETIQSVMKALEKNPTAMTLLVSSLVGAAVGSAFPQLPRELAKPRFATPWGEFVFGVSLPGITEDDPHARAKGAAEGAAGAMVIGAATSILTEALELRSLSAKASLI